MKKLILNFSTAILCFTATAQIPNYVPSNGLLGWWPFNGNANDESGNGNHGTVNGATLTVDRFGNANQAYGFDGVNDFIQCGQLQLNLNASFSVWIAPMESLNIGQHSRILNVSECGGGGCDRWHLSWAPSAENFQAHFGIHSPISDFTINSNTSVTQFNYSHLVVLYSNGFVSFYINGAHINSGFVGINNLSQIDAPSLDIASVLGQNSFFNGKIDDIGVWNRALTHCEILDLYYAQLNVNQGISAGVDQTICFGDNVTLNGSGGSNYQWNNNVVDGQAFAPTQSNAYVVNGTDTLGCQGTDTVVVTVLESPISTLTETALDSYTLNGQTYTESGTYTQTLTAANGCDSTITLNLTLNFTGMDELVTSAKKLVKITDLNGKIIPRRKNTLMLFIYEDGTVERVVEMEE